MKTNLLKKWIKTKLLNEKGTFSGRKLNSILKCNKNIEKLILDATFFCPKDFPIFQRIKMILNDVTEFKKCANCKTKNVSWSKSNNKILDYCSIKCASSHSLTREKIKQTNLILFGVEHIMKDEEFKNNYKNVCLKKYGVKNASQSKKIKDKKKETSIKNWGVENVSQSEKIKNKKKNTSLKNYKTEYPSQAKEVKEKTKKTNFRKYGVKCPLQNEEIKKKSIKTNNNKFGVEFPMQAEEIKQKSLNTRKEKYGENLCVIHEKIKTTMMLRYGVEYAAQNKEFYKKMQINSCKIFKYKDSELFYQGSYEKYFLEQMDANGLLSKVNNGKCYEYILNDTKHKYYVDFFYNDLNIEIKSKWTYNKNGKDKELELENKTKWEAVKNKNEKIIVLFSKQEIYNFVKTQIS